MNEPRYLPGLEDVIVEFQQWLDLPDPTPLIVGMAAVVATRGEGKPPWVIIVGAASTAKTELITPLQACDDVFSLSTSSVAGLLTTRKGAGPGDGLLYRIAKTKRPGTVLVRDLAALLFSTNDSTSDVLNLLRDAYDGTIEREGGFGKATAKGKFGFIGAATNAVDRHHQAMGELGPRFLYCRTEMPDADRSVKAVLRRFGQGDQWRDHLGQVVANHIGHGSSNPPVLSDVEVKGMASLCRIATRARGYVPRDSRGEVIGAEEVEGVPRMAEALGRMIGALDAIGCSRAESWRIVTKMALDCMTQDRRYVLHALAERGVPLGAGALSDLTTLPRRSAGRAAEDLTMTGLLTSSGGDGGHPTWTLTHEARSWWREKSPPPPVGGTWRTDSSPPAADGTPLDADSPVLGPQDVAEAFGLGAEEQSQWW